MRPFENAECPYSEHSVAILIGLAPVDVRRLARVGNLGRPEEGSGELRFSYPELLELSLMAARSHD